MKRVTRFKFLHLFGDGTEHNWFETVFLGCNFLKVRQSKFEKLFKEALENQLIVRVESPQSTMAKLSDSYAITWKEFHYKLTQKGDDCLRNEQICRKGDPLYYGKFDRTIDGEYGLNRFAPLPKGIDHEKR